jgi:hypothetical protein
MFQISGISTRKKVGSIVALSALLGVTACTNMSPETREKMVSLAGTVLDVITMNFSGSVQTLAETAIMAFNGEPVTEQQLEQDPYVDYSALAYADDASADYAEYQTAGYFPAGAPSIDASLIGLDDVGELMLLDNGATLRGPGNGHSGDRVGVAFAPANDTYIYIISFDSTGWAQSLYPDDVMGHRNPVAAGEEVFLPGDMLYGLDNVTGVETIYILASNNPQPDVLASMQPFFGKERPAAANTVFRSVERPIIISRGLTGLRPASVNAEALGYAGSDFGASSDSGSMALNSFLAAEGAEELVVTLWFNHE